LQKRRTAANEKPQGNVSSRPASTTAIFVSFHDGKTLAFLTIHPASFTEKPVFPVFSTYRAVGTKRETEERADNEARRTKGEI